MLRKFQVQFLRLSVTMLFATGQQSVFVYKKQFKISNNLISDCSTNIKTKTCSAPTEPSYATRPETKNNPGLKRISAMMQQFPYRLFRQ